MTDSRFREQVAFALADRCRVQPGDELVVAVSGGLDSMCLLTVLAQLAQQGALGKVAAVTVNHQTRDFGQEADAVRSLSAALDVPWKLQTLEPGLPQRARDQGKSLEHQMRTERYAALQQAMDSWQIRTLALAHTADDQAETVILRLARGAGMNGLSGMQFRTLDDRVRPLLAVRRKQLEEYAQVHSVPFVTDPTNAEARFARNRVRREILPLLEDVFPAASEVIARNAGIMGRQLEAVEQLLDQRLQGVLEEDDEGLQLPVETLGEGPLRGMLLRRLFDLAGIYPPEAIHFQQLEQLLDSTAGSSKLSLPGGAHVRREYGTVKIVLQSSKTPSFEVEVGGEGKVELPGGILEVVRLNQGSFIPSGDGLEAVFSEHELQFPLRVRSWNRGDRFWPFGFKGTRKVSDLFAEHRVPRSRRLTIPLLTDQDDVILWVVGLRRSAHWPLQRNDPAVLVRFVPC